MLPTTRTELPMYAGVLLLFLSVFGCQRKVEVKLPQPLSQNNYIEIAPNTYQIWAADHKTLEEIKTKAIQCGICRETPAGFVVIVERFPEKPKY